MNITTPNRYLVLYTEANDVGLLMGNVAFEAKERLTSLRGNQVAR